MMTRPQIRVRPSRIHKVPDCGCYGFESWLGKQSLATSDLQHILKEWRSIPNQTPYQLFPSSPSGLGWHLLPKPPHPHFSDPPRLRKDVSEVETPVLHKLLEFIEELAKIDYQVIITNNTDSDLEDLTVHYFANTIVGSSIQTTGPFQKSLAALPPGETVDFHTTDACLAMADNYFITFKYNGTAQTIQENVSQLNREELATTGRVDFCGDSLEVYLS